MRFIISCVLLFLNFSAYAVNICAHRGGRALFPENTLEALVGALQYPIDCIDMDVVLSQDQIPIIYHDFYLNPDFTRDAQGRWLKTNTLLLKKLKLSEIQKYQLGKINPHRAYAKYFPHQQTLPRTTIPSLDQGLKTILQHEQKPIEIQIELKTEPNNPQSPSCHALSMAVSKLIYQFHLEQRSKIQSFDWPCLIHLHRHYPDLKLAFLTELNPMIPTLYRNTKEIPRRIKQLHGDYWDAEDRQLSKKDISRAHQLGLKVCAWSYADDHSKQLEQRHQKLIDAGIDCIISDRPDLEFHHSSK